jgi:hypothetical protein
MNKQAMGFATGGFVMSHAIGTLKPWRKNMLLDSLKGRIPMVLKADAEYVKYSNGPISAYSVIHLFLKKLDRKLSTLVARVRGG